MAKASETGNVCECAANEMLRTSLPVMYTELEKCQKSLEGYLEQKRNKFPRFYFVSNPGEGPDCVVGLRVASFTQYCQKFNGQLKTY